MKHKYFVKTVSYPAPFFPDTELTIVSAKSPEEALGLVRGRSETQDVRLQYIAVYYDANVYYEKESPIATWRV